MLGSGAILIDSIVTIMTIIAVLSILLGNFLAVRQVNLKRILAYSSIWAHFGYLMIGLISMNCRKLGQCQRLCDYLCVNHYWCVWCSGINVLARITT